MAKKLASKGGASKQVAKKAKDSTHQIWLAGLGALAKAQEEGGNLFESLVKKGQQAEASTKKAAKDQAKDVKTKASDIWEKLEQGFEERVSSTLTKLGVSTQDDLHALAKRVEQLNKDIKALTEGK